MDDRVGVLTLTVRDVDALPGRKRPDALDHGFAPTPKGNELNPLAIEFRELGIAGELGVKDKGGGESALLLFPEIEKAQDLLVGFIALNVGCGVKDELGGGILGKQGERPLHGFVPGTGPVVLQNGLLPEVGNGVKVQIDQIGVIEPEPGGLLDEALLQAQQVNRIQAVGIGGHSRALGQHVETGEKAQARIEGMLGEMGIAFGADQFEGEKGQKVVQGGNGFCAGQAGLLHDLGQIELIDEGGKQQNACGLRLPGAFGHLGKRQLLCHGRHLSAFDRQTEFQAAAPGQSRVALFGQHPLDCTHRDLNPFFGQKCRDLSGRKTMLAPVADLGLERSVEPAAVGFAFGDGFGEVDFLMSEQVSEQVNIGQRIAKTLGDDAGRQAIDKGGSQGLIAALPFMDGVEEEALITHEKLIAYGGYNVNI